MEVNPDDESGDFILDVDMTLVNPAFSGALTLEELAQGSIFLIYYGPGRDLHSRVAWSWAVHTSHDEKDQVVSAEIAAYLGDAVVSLSDIGVTPTFAGAWNMRTFCVPVTKDRIRMFARWLVKTGDPRAAECLRQNFPEMFPWWKRLLHLA